MPIKFLFTLDNWHLTKALFTLAYWGSIKKCGVQYRYSLFYGGPVGLRAQNRIFPYNEYIEWPRLCLMFADSWWTLWLSIWWHAPFRYLSFYLIASSQVCSRLHTLHTTKMVNCKSSLKKVLNPIRSLIKCSVLFFFIAGWSLIHVLRGCNLQREINISSNSLQYSEHTLAALSCRQTC